MEKLRILWVGESTYLNTGFSVYAQNVLTHLYASNKYEIAELGCYGKHNDPRKFNIPWRYYENFPLNPEEEQKWQNPNIQFGAGRFEEVLLDFRPHICISIRDPWMDDFIRNSPLRPYFHWCHMPTIDSAPLMPQWIDMYLNADSIFTYSEFGRDTIIEEGSGRANFVDVAGGGIHTNHFHPLPNRMELRDKMGIPQDAIIIGTLMRNQRRKLYPDLFEAFEELLKKHPTLTENVYLYCHTSYPDLGWDIPRLLREHNIGHKVFFTYVCRKCGHVFGSLFADARAFCHNCQTVAGSMPGTQAGVPTERLKEVYNLFDLYVQLYIAAGLELPIVEAAACGVYPLGVDYSGGQSALTNVGGGHIKVDRFFRECETHAMRCYPDKDDLIEKIVSFIKMPPSIRAKKGRVCYMKAHATYNWERISQIWEKHLDTLTPNSKWSLPPSLFDPNAQPPGQMSNADFVRWAILNVMHDPSLLDSYYYLRMVRDLNWEARINGYGGPYYNEHSFQGNRSQYTPYNQQMCLDELKQLRQITNYFEQRRTGMIPERNEQYLSTVKPDIKEITL